MLQRFRMAARNIRRNRKRTIITLAAVVIGIFVIVLVKGLLAGIQGNIVREVTQNLTGDLQIQAKGYKESNESFPLDLNVQLTPEMQQAIGQVPGVEGWSPRIRFAGLISTGADSAMFLGLAVDPAGEALVTPKALDSVTEGTYVQADDPLGIVLSQELATSLGIKLGDEVTILSNTREGAMNGADLKVVGFLSANLPSMPTKMLIMHRAKAMELLDMDNRATEITVALSDEASVSDVKAALLQVPKAPNQELAVFDWEELMPFFQDIIGMQNFMYNMILVVLFFMVLTGIANTMLMTVFERTREIGTMMALGMKRRHVVELFLMEALILGALGAMLGLGVAYAVITGMASTGIHFIPPGTGREMLIIPELVPSSVVFAMTFGVVCALVSAAWPAWRAGKLKPVEALRA